MWHQSVNCNFTKPQEYFFEENKNNDFIPLFDASTWWCKRWSRSSGMTLNTRHVFNAIPLDLDQRLRHHALVSCTVVYSVFSWLRKITVDRLMSHGLLCRSSWYFSGPWLCKDLLSGRVRELSWFKLKYLNLCSEDELRPYGFGTTSGWVINDIIFIFGWTNPLRNRMHITERFHL